MAEPIPAHVLDAVAQARHDAECQCAGRLHPRPALRSVWLPKVDAALLQIAWPVLAAHWSGGMVVTEPPPEASICRNCGKPIVFEPYFLDGKEPNPPRWFHPPGSVTCSTNPKHLDGWPKADPLDPSG